jgi:hypothetical protein
MGDLITGVIERQVGGRWICVDTLTAVRQGPGWDDYEYPRGPMLRPSRWAALEPRGLPADISETGLYMAQIRRSKSFGEYSWLPLRDAAEIFLESDSVEAKAAASIDPCDYYFNVTGNDAASFRFVWWWY